MSKHTPGPWVWAERHHGLYGAGPNNAVLDWFPYEGMHLIANAEANARLIAAAPDLLKACQQALYALKGREHDGFLRDAIFKATGERA